MARTQATKDRRALDRFAKGKAPQVCALHRDGLAEHLAKHQVSRSVLLHLRSVANSGPDDYRFCDQCVENIVSGLDEDELVDAWRAIGYRPNA